MPWVGNFPRPNHFPRGIGFRVTNHDGRRFDAASATGGLMVAVPLGRHDGDIVTWGGAGLVELAVRLPQAMLFHAVGVSVQRGKEWYRVR